MPKRKQPEPVVAPESDSELEEPIKDPDAGASGEFSDDEPDVVAEEEISFTNEEAEDEDEEDEKRYTYKFQINDDLVKEYPKNLTGGPARGKVTYSFKADKGEICKPMGICCLKYEPKLHGAGKMEINRVNKEWTQKFETRRPKCEAAVVTDERLLNKEGTGQLPPQKVPGVAQSMKRTTLDWLNMFNDTLYPWLVRKTKDHKTFQTKYDHMKKKIAKTSQGEAEDAEEFERQLKNFFLREFKLVDPENADDTVQLEKGETIKQLADRVGLNVTITGDLSKGINDKSTEKEKEVLKQLKESNDERFKKCVSKERQDGEEIYKALARCFDQIPLRTKYLKYNGEQYKVADSQTGEVTVNHDRVFLGRWSIVEPMVQFEVTIDYDKGSVAYRWSFEKFNPPTISVYQREKPYERDSAEEPSHHARNIPKRARFAAAAE